MLAICALQQFIQFVHCFMQDQNISQTARILNKLVIHFVVTVFYFLHHILWKVVLLKLFVLSLNRKNGLNLMLHYRPGMSDQYRIVNNLFLQLWRQAL